MNHDWRNIVENVVIENWKESLSMLVTYSKAEEFSELCCVLGERLQTEANDHVSAMLCYICAGDVGKILLNGVFQRDITGLYLINVFSPDPFCFLVKNTYFDQLKRL